MKLKTKIGIISLGVIALLVAGIGIYWLVSKKGTTSLKFVSKEVTSTLKQVKEKLPKKLEPKLIWQKEFDSKIEDMRIFTSPKSESDMPIMSVETQKNTFLFDQKGYINRSFPYIPYEQRYFIRVSENGKYVMEDKIVEEFTSDIKYTTFKGDLLWEEKHLGVGYDISPTGEMIVLQGCHAAPLRPEYYPYVGGLLFYTKEGKIIKEYPPKLFIDGSCFSGDGNYFVFRGRYMETDEPMRLILSDKYGNILWEKDLMREVNINSLGISMHGERIFICEDSTVIDKSYLRVFDNRGNLLFVKDNLKEELGEYPEQGYIEISLDGDFLVVPCEKFTILYDSFTGKELWRIKKGKVLCISPDSNFIFSWLPEYEKEKKGGYIMNRKGKKLFYIEFTSLEQIKAVIFSKDSRFLYVVTSLKENALYIYRYRVRLN